MLENTPIQALMNATGISSLIESIRVSDPTAFGIEITIGIIAIVIALVIFGLQLRADRKMKQIVKQIEKYT